MTEVNIKVDQTRFADEVSIDEYLALIENDFKTMINVISRFVIGDDGAYLSEKEGRKLVGSLKLAQLKDISQAFIQGAGEAAVPKGNGAS